MAGYVYRDGSRLTPYMLYQINRADADFFKRFGCHLLVTSGIRTNAEQTRIFLSKYRLQATGSGPYGDVRWWQGRRYVRHVGGGTVAAPSTSNHEIQGTKAAADLRDSGSGPGVATGGNERADWLRAKASKYGLVPEGYGFGEPWHYAVLNIFNNVPGSGVAAGGGSSSESEEDDMYTDADRKRDETAAKRMDATYAAVFGARNLTGKDDPVSWQNRGGVVQKANYGMLPIVIHNQTLIAQQSGRIAAMEEVVEQLAKSKGVVLDMKAIAAAAEKGAKSALSGLVLTANG